MPVEDTTTDEPTPSNELSELRDLVVKLNKRLDSQSAILERLRKKEPSDDSTSSGSVGQKPEGLEAKVRALEERQRQLDERDAANKRRDIATAISRALKKAGIQDFQAEDLAKVEVAERLARFEVEGGEVVFKDKDDGDTLNLDSWARVFVASDRGRAYLPEKRNPRIGVDARDKGGRNAKALSLDDLANGRFDPNAKPTDFVLTDE